MASRHSYPVTPTPASSLPDARGRFGDFGGAFVPEILHPVLEEVKEAWQAIQGDDDFWAEHRRLLRDYVGRPTPLTRADRLAERIGARGPIYLKREDLCHTGAHKINNAIGQVQLAMRMGKTRIIAETGAGQHGVATATACALFGVECVVYMGEEDIHRQNLNVQRMRLLGAEVRPAMSGSRTLKDATNEAFRDWVSQPARHALRHRLRRRPAPVSGARARLPPRHRRGDARAASGGRGPRDAGRDRRLRRRREQRHRHLGALRRRRRRRARRRRGRWRRPGAGPETRRDAQPRLPRRLPRLALLPPPRRDGQVQEAHSISAGLDYPGVGPEHAYHKSTGRVDYRPVTDDEAMTALQLLAETEGIIPALETAHAVALLTPLAKERPDAVVVLNCSGRGDKDMETITARLNA